RLVGAGRPPDGTHRAKARMSEPIRVNRVLISGSFWTSAAEISSALIELVTSIVAARILTLRDFGLFGTAMLMLGLLEHFSQTGFESALVQKADDPESHLNVTFTWHLMRGAGMAAILAVSAPLLASWYDDPPLLAVMLALAVVPPVGGLRN